MPTPEPSSRCYIPLDHVEARYGVEPEDAQADPDGPLIVTLNGRPYATADEIERWLRWREIDALTRRVGRGGSRILHLAETGEHVDLAELRPLPVPGADR